MAKNTNSTAFRRIDVDKYSEDNYKVSFGPKCSFKYLKRSQFSFVMICVLIDYFEIFFT